MSGNPSKQNEDFCLPVIYPFKNIACSATGLIYLKYCIAVVRENQGGRKLKMIPVLFCNFPAIISKYFFGCFVDPPFTPILFCGT